MFRAGLYRRRSYLSATLHPWPSLLFLLPLLVVYEAGVFWLGGPRPEALRNGADTWLRWGLESLGLPQLYWPPVLIAAIFLVWSWTRRHERPRDLVGVCMGMALESGLFAVGLWGLSRGLGPLLDHFGVALQQGPHAEAVLRRLVTFVGAGIYEEVLFRLLLFSGLGLTCRFVGVPAFVAFLGAAVGSATLFAAAHIVGPYGEAYDGYVFLFRTLAGLYFVLLYQLRGFGVAVGAHAGYDVLVGVLITS